MTRLGTRLIIEVNVSDTAGNNCRNLIVSCLGQLLRDLLVSATVHVQVEIQRLLIS
jgi:hypothetical protein